MIKKVNWERWIKKKKRGLTRKNKHILDVPTQHWEQHRARCSPQVNRTLIPAELRRLRQEHTEAAEDNKKALARLETNMKELMERTTSLEQQVKHVEERLGNTEDKTARLERMASFLLHKEAKLTAKCEDFKIETQ